MSQAETIGLMIGRWKKLGKDLYSKKKDLYDVSKIPDIYDSVKYDSKHNSKIPVPEVQT